MGEILDAFVARYKKERNSSKDNEAKVKLKNHILQMASELLDDPQKALLFEVEESFAPYVDVMIEDPDITEFYLIRQAPNSTTEFIIQAKEIELS